MQREGGKRKDLWEGIMWSAHFLTHVAYFADILFLILQALSSRAWMGTRAELPLGWTLQTGASDRDTCTPLTTTELLGWMEGMDAEPKVRAEDGSRRVEQEHGHWQAVLKYLFSFPIFLIKISFLFPAKTKPPFFSGQTHFCRSQMHSFVPKPFTRESGFSV